jgi:hypothetical protein
LKETKTRAFMENPDYRTLALTSVCELRCALALFQNQHLAAESAGCQFADSRVEGRQNPVLFGRVRQQQGIVPLRVALQLGNEWSEDRNHVAAERPELVPRMANRLCQCLERVTGADRTKPR